MPRKDSEAEVAFRVFWQRHDVAGESWYEVVDRLNRPPLEERIPWRSDHFPTADGHADARHRVEAEQVRDELRKKRAVRVLLGVM